MTRKNITVCLLLLLSITVACENTPPKSGQPTAIGAKVTEGDIIEQLKKNYDLSSSFDFPFEYIVETSKEYGETDGFFVVVQSKEKEYPPIGVAFFENISDHNKHFANISADYKLKFANLQAMMCDGCNNSLHRSIESVSENDGERMLVIGISWGPRQSQYDKHFFVFDKETKQWILRSISADWLSGERYVDTRKWKISLDKFDIEEDGFSRDKFLPEYSAGDWKKMASTLKELYTYSLNENLRNPLLEQDVKNMIKNIDIKNVQYANDCGYYLEQVGELEQARTILEAVVEKFPDRMVAYMNIGDVYRKLDKQPEAQAAYAKYINKMKNRNLAHKIPGYIISYNK